MQVCRTGTASTLLFATTLVQHRQVRILNTLFHLAELCIGSATSMSVVLYQSVSLSITWGGRVT